MKWWTKLQHWYARKYVCPFWGHKSAEESWWTDSNGMVTVLGRVGRRCDNCGEAIPNEDA